MSRVFIIQATKNQADVSPCQVYGNPIFLLTASDRTSKTPELFRKKLRVLLGNFDADNDFILWSGGDPLSLLLAGSVLSELGYEKIRYLRYERPDVRQEGAKGFYVPVEVTL
jgi:hypothetical protein